MSVRALRWWDIGQVSVLERELFPEDAWTVEQFWQELAQDTRVYLVADGDAGVGGKALDGYAGAFVLAPDSDVQTIAVRADRQGAGIASTLLSALMARALAAGCTHMMLEVRADNARAIGLYERHGFARISQRRAYYPDGADALIMRARLGADS